MQITGVTPVKWPQKLYDEMEKWVAKYPVDQKQSAVLPVLLLVQEHHEGWLNEDQLNAVADYLNMPRVAVYEVATFYSMYDLKPVGQHKISLCTNVSCLLAGSDRILCHLKKRLNIDLGQTTPNGLFTLREVECLAACVGAPMMQIDKTYYENLTEERVDHILSEYSSKEG